MTRKNTHMTHIDESIFEGGQSASMQIKNVLESGDFKLTTKWDGAPSIFVGRDPADGQFFIGTKSVFNKTPKLYKHILDIYSNEPDSKADKLVQAFSACQQLTIPDNTVLQGDLIFTNDSLFIRDGYVMAHANTLIYAWDMGTDEALRVFTSDIGIVFHTTYTGSDDLQNYTANFGCDVDALNAPIGFWIKSADLNVRVESPGVPEMSEAADTILRIMDQLPADRIGAHIKTFYNSRIRQGIQDKPSLTEYVRFVDNYYQTKVFTKYKTEKSVQKATEQMDAFLTDVLDNADAFYEAFDYVVAIETVKGDLLFQIWEQCDQVVFVDIAGKLFPTKHEGFVLIDNKTGDAWKLVDRYNFSFFNFSSDVKKGWEKA